MTRPANLCSLVEHFIHDEEEFSKLSNDQIKYIWDQRSWHPVVKSKWAALIDCQGDGVINYPDGSSCTY